MSAHTWRLIDWFKTNQGKSSTRLAINSNLGTDIDIDRLLDSTHGMGIDLYTSNEAISTHAEYIRDGLVWDDWANNVERLLDSGRFRGIHVMCTINALCLDSLDSFLECVMNWKREYGKEAINFSLNILRFPSFQSLTVFPEHIRSYYYNKLHDFADSYRHTTEMQEFEWNQLQRLLGYIHEVSEAHKEAMSQIILQKDFKNFYTQYDQRRGKDFCATFPALADWYNTL
jgi:hypothetical protein